MKKIYLKIAEFARLCNTTKDTLIHYDGIGILKPCYTGENKYRYYEINQLEIFHLISSLKDIGFSLECIKTQIKTRSVENYHNVLKDQEKVLGEKIKQLEETKRAVAKHAKEIEQYLQIRKGEVFVQNMSEQTCILSQKKLDFENNIAEAHFDYSRLTTQLKKNYKNIYHIYGLIKTRRQIDQKQNFIYENIYLTSPQEISNYTITAGDFLVIYEQTDYNDILPSYDKLIDYAQKNALKIDDNFYEEIIFSFLENENTKKDPEYIVKMRVKIL